MPHTPRRAVQAFRQRTIKSSIGCVGIGLHSGRKTRLTLNPGAIDTGIVFRRTDLRGERDIHALWSNVVDTRLCSGIANRDGASVGTVEHLLAALAGAEIDNCLIEIDGPEVPAMDGSAAPFLFLLDCAGSVDQAAPRRAIQVLRRVAVTRGSKSVTLEPAASFAVSCAIEFDSAAIARQSMRFDFDPARFRDEIALARTFGFAADVARLRAAGLARGGSLENAVVIEGDRVLNREGVRFRDEFVRHKVLDCVGDLYLAGAPLLARVRSERAGHELNNLVLRELFSRDDAWRLVDLNDVAAETVATRRPAARLVIG